MDGNQTGREKRSLTSHELHERQHPLKTYLFFGLVGSSILFLSLLFMYIIWSSHNPPLQHFQMPKAFMMSTVILLFSSFTINNSLKAFKNDETKNLLISLSGSLGLAVIFAILQIWGWKSLYDGGFFLNGEAGISFLYIVTALHFLHLGAGMLYLFFLCLKAFDNWNDPVRALLFFSNKHEGTRIELMNTYWHFIDALWIVLFFSFLFSL
ncbi:cytochrome c oxidase subunit 3 [soil metagenome]